MTEENLKQWLREGEEGEGEGGGVGEGEGEESKPALAVPTLTLAPASAPTCKRMTAANHYDEINRQRALTKLTYEYDHFDTYLWGLAKPILAFITVCIMLFGAATLLSNEHGGGSGSGHNYDYHSDSR